MTGTTAAALAAALAAWAWTPVSAQQAAGQAPADQTPTFRTGVEAVSVDVNVIDRQGVPVRGLKPEDFHVTVAGQPRRIITAEFIERGSMRTDALAVEGATISSNEGSGLGRLFVFVVDQNTLEPGSVRHVARAANRFLSGLGFTDRSALLLMPSGPNVQFTWAHDRVHTALQRVVGQSTSSNAWEFGSLSDARDIANRNMLALRNVGQRECGTGVSAGLDGFGAAPIGGPTPTQAPTGGGTPQGGGTTGGSGTTPAGGNQPSGGGTPRGGGNTGGGGSNRIDNCTRELQMRAEWAWRGAQMTSLASISALRRTLGDLERIQGDKTVILISGGWPLDEREQNSLISTVAAEAAAARATFFTMFVPGSTTSASRRLVSTTPANDQWLHLWPLETLAGMTGGGSFRVEVSADSAFERLGRELSGFYRIGVEKNATDGDTKSRRMKVQVSRPSVTVRARDLFDVRTYEDRDWAGRLASALEGPIPATGIGLRVTSYLGADPEDVTRVKLVLTGEATRLEPGDAKVQVLVRDLDGKKLMAGEQAIGEPNGEGLSFTANVPILPGSYIVRVAVIDGNGRVGSVDHRADVRPAALGELRQGSFRASRAAPSGVEQRAPGRTAGDAGRPRRRSQPAFRRGSHVRNRVVRGRTVAGPDRG
jgi:VWFA-related protein